MSSYLAVVIPVMSMDYFYRATRLPPAIFFCHDPAQRRGAFSTLTRSSWAGLFVGMLIVLWGMRSMESAPAKGKAAFLTSHKGLLLAAMILMVFVWPHGGKGSPSVIERLVEIKKASQESYGSVYQRFLIWLSAWGMVQDHPFMGKGWGCFELFYPFYQGPILLEKGLNLRTHANNAHNEILEYWSQIGTIGLGVALWMWTLFFRLGISLARRLAGPSKALLWGFLGGVAAMLVDNLLNVSIFFCIPAFIFWWWVGSAMALDPAALVVRRIDLRPAWRRGVAALCAPASCASWAVPSACGRGKSAFSKASSCLRRGWTLSRATRDLESAYAWHHLEVNNNYELGNVYARLGDKANALRMYRRAIDANSGYDEIYFNRATMLMQEGRNAEAIASYRICLAINPMSHEAYNALATLYFKNVAAYGPDIETLYLRGVEVYPNDRDMWNNLGYLYTQRMDWVKAASAYQKAIQIDPHFDLARRNLAVVLQKMGAVSGASGR